MNSHLKSLRQIFAVMITGLTSVAIGLGVTGCSSGRKKVEVNTNVPREVSLRADRERFSKMRESIPVEERIENDELALILESMNRPDEDPQRVRDRFNSLVTKKREKFNKLMQKERDNFTKSEKERREQFLTKQQSERKRRSASGKSPEETRAFYAKLDAKRIEYSSEERDRRLEFDSLMREKRSNFEAHIRDITAKFNDEHRNYSRLHRDYKMAKDIKRRTTEAERREMLRKELAKEKGAEASSSGEDTGQLRQTNTNVTDEDIQSFQNIPAGQGHPLGSDSN